MVHGVFRLEILGGDFHSRGNLRDPLIYFCASCPTCESHRGFLGDIFTKPRRLRLRAGDGLFFNNFTQYSLFDVAFSGII